MPRTTYSYRNEAAYNPHEFMHDAFCNTNALFQLKGGNDRKGIFVPGIHLATENGGNWIQQAIESDFEMKKQKVFTKYGEEYHESEYQPKNMKVSTCGFKADGNATKANIEVIAMIQIRLDYNPMRGKQYASEERRILNQLEEEILKPNNVPIPTFYLNDGQVDLIYIFTNAVPIPSKMVERKTLIDKIEARAKSICKAINAVDAGCNAQFNGINDSIYIPGTYRELKQPMGMDRYGNQCFRCKYSCYVRAHRNGQTFTIDTFLADKEGKIPTEKVYTSNETRRFLSVLMHDKKDAYIAVGRKKNDRMTHTYYKDLNEIQITKKDLEKDCYVCLHPLNNKSCLAANVFNYNAFFIDLDNCSKQGNGLKKNINHTRILLTGAFMEDKLPKPTMMVCTGGGLALYYVLRRSIPAISEKAKWKYFDVWKYLMKYIQDFLSQNVAQLYVDTSVATDARLCRLPGTVNQKNNNKCCLLWENQDSNGEMLYWDMDKLCEVTGYNQFYQTMKENRKQAELNKVYPSNQQEMPTDNLKTQPERKKHGGGNRYNKNNLQIRRIYQIINYLELIDYSCQGHRNTILFYLCNCLIHLMDFDKVMDILLRVNAEFDVPLRAAEIISSMNSVKRHYAENRKGYFFTTEKMLWDFEILDNEEICKEIGVGQSLRDLKNMESNYVHKFNQQCVTRNAVYMAIHNPDLSIAEIAEILGKSKSWVEKTLAKYGVKKNGKKGSEMELPVVTMKKRKIIVAELLEEV